MLKLAGRIVLQTEADRKFAQGLALHRVGRLAEAQTIYADILKSDPFHFDALNTSGIASLQEQRFEQGLRFLERALKVDPTSALSHHNKGVALENLDRSAEAVASYGKAIQAEPQYAEAYFNRGNALCTLGRFDDAVASYTGAVRIDPHYADAFFNRGAALKAGGFLAGAVADYDHAIALKPGFLDAHFSRGEVLGALNKPEDAILSYDRAIQIDPNCVAAHFNRANALSHLGRMDQAIAGYRKAVALKPDYSAVHNNLGVALAGVSRFEALASYDKALDIDPQYPEALNNRGNVLRELFRLDEALRDYDKAIALKPAYAEAYENKGLVLAELGRLDGAVAALEQSIEIAPGRVRAHYNLTQSKRFEPGDPHLATMLEMERHASSLPVTDRIHLNFALGKALADVGDTDASFNHLIAGNALKRAEIAYDEAAAMTELERAQTAFAAERLHRIGGGEPSSIPVFIVGMPRSGSTLVEQILAAHPSVFGAGEIVDFNLALAEFGDGAAAPLNDLAAAGALNDQQLERLGASYLRRIQPIAPDAQRIVNKTLDNFRFLGLIHLASPSARIIHIRRDPVDTCLSCFSKLFVGSLPYLYDLGELGRYYRAYEALMAHWRDALPAGVMLEVQYETLVAETEQQARRIVTHIGLPWDPACLDFHRAERPVRTASLVQVRQPIYASAVGRWRAYQAHLKPLFDGLGYDPSEPMS